jgi:hypothetical protein
MSSATEHANHEEVLQGEAAQAADPAFTGERGEEQERETGIRLLQALERLLPPERRGVLQEIADEATSLLTQWRRGVDRSCQEQISRLRTELNEQLTQSLHELDLAAKADLKDIEMQVSRLRRDISRLSRNR